MLWSYHVFVSFFFVVVFFGFNCFTAVRFPFSCLRFGLAPSLIKAGMFLDKTHIITLHYTYTHTRPHTKTFSFFQSEAISTCILALQKISSVPLVLFFFLQQLSTIQPHDSVASTLLALVATFLSFP